MTANTTAAYQWYPPWTQSALPTVDSVFNPSPTQSGLPNDCQEYYQAQKNDTCMTITSTLRITDKDFKNWNPALGDDCAGLKPGYWYCVLNWKTPPMPSTTTALPSAAATQTGITTNCTSWYQAEDGDDCELIPLMFGTFSQTDFQKWNPALGSNCTGIKDGDWYCVGIPGTPSTRTQMPSSWMLTPPPLGSSVVLPSSLLTSTVSSTTSTSSATTGTASPSTCSRYYTIQKNDYCDTIAREANIPLSTFYDWNPSLNCSALEPGKNVCIALSGPATTITTGTPIPLTPSPTQSGMVTGCRRFYEAQSNDSCEDLAHDAGVEVSDFYSWNPAVSTDCGGLQVSTFVCVGTSGPYTTITSGTPVPATTW
ncbi:hypothetical protein MW887_004828 [Aspergillus wentii]|nr:hypothetical protein MW887_004828 [Aspergillus wentii]